MFVRAKRVGRRRYLYLVEGKREGGSIKQKTLCYLGPLSRLVAGVPEIGRWRARGGERDVPPKLLYLVKLTLPSEDT